MRAREALSPCTERTPNVFRPFRCRKGQREYHLSVKKTLDAHAVIPRNRNELSFRRRAYASFPSADSSRRNAELCCRFRSGDSFSYSCGSKTHKFFSPFLCSFYKNPTFGAKHVDNYKFLCYSVHTEGLQTIGNAKLASIFCLSKALFAVGFVCCFNFTTKIRSCQAQRCDF